MNGLHRVLGLLAASALVGSTAVQAEGFHTGRDCGRSNFSTCAAVQVSAAGMRDAIGARRSFGDDFAGGVRTHPFEIIELSDGFSFNHGRPIPSATHGCPVPSGNPLDCAATTVAPEPVTMTLLATGLLGMSGMGLVRRKKRHLNE